MEDSLATVVKDLTALHHRAVDTEDGTVEGAELPLLTLLERAIASDSGRGSAPGGGRSGGPVDAGALTLWESIRDVVNRNWPGAGDPNMAGWTLINRLRKWAEAVSGTADEVHLLEFCVYWRHSIRTMLEPPQQVPLRGERCPICLHSHRRQYDEDTQTFDTALVAHMSEDPVRVECRACDYEWVGGEILDLRAAMAR